MIAIPFSADYQPPEPVPDWVADMLYEIDRDFIISYHIAQGCQPPDIPRTRPRP
jgi:hypothetical protein